MTDYLRLAQERAPLSADMQDNEYLSLAQERQKQEQARARTVIESALKDDPELAAERRRLSNTTGLSPDIVRRNQDMLRLKEQVHAFDLVSMAEESPVLYRQLLDPNFTTTAVDDLGTLKNIERMVGRGAQYIMGADGKGGLPADTLDFTKDVGLGATVGVGKMIIDIAGATYDLAGWQSGAEDMRYFSKRAKESMEYFGSQGKSSTAQGIRSGAQSAGTNVALLPIGLERGLFATAEAAAAAVAGIMATGVGADAYNTAREKGLSQLQAAGYAIPQAGFEYVFERIPASKLFGDIAANTGLLKTLGKQAVSEGWTEQLTTLTQDFNTWMNLNPEKTLSQFIQERPEAAYQTFVATLVGVGVQTSAIKGINKIVEQASNAALKFDQDMLQQQMALSAQSMLRQRSPEQFRSHVQSVLDNNDGAKKEIYIDAEVLNQLPQELLAQLPDSVRDQIPDALSARSTISIPMADVLTIAPGTELEQIINDNARIRPNSASKVEANLAAEYLQQDAERVLKQAVDQNAWQQSATAVKTAILEQLNTTGRFTPDVNEAYAALQMNFFSSMAARVGVTPEELYQRYSLKVAAKQVGKADPVLDQNGNLTPKYKKLLSESKVVDAAGKPLRMYHGTGSDIRKITIGKRGVFFVTPNAQFAESYAGGATETLAPNIMPVYVNARNPFDYQNAEHIKNLADTYQKMHGEALFDKTGVDTFEGAIDLKNLDTNSIADRIRSGDWTIIEDKKVQEAIKEAGFDAFYVAEGDVKNLGVYSPEQIVSVFDERQADGNFNQAAVERLTSAAERGQRVTGSRAMISAEEKDAIKASSEKTGVSVAEITKAVREHKLAHPVAQGWAPLVYNRTVLDDKGKVVHEYKNTPYDFSVDKDGKQLEPGSPAYDRRTNAVARGMVDEVRRIFTRATNGDKNAQNILAQAGWYKAMRSRLRQEFGGLGDLFADLLGATSPNTPVRDNWTNAVDSLRRASRGDFDALIPQWEAWADNVDALESSFRAWFNERTAEGLSKKDIKALPEYKSQLDALKAARKLDDSLLPTKESGKKYGFNGRNVARAMVDLWRVVKNADADIARGGTAPKALNFSGNLIGFRERATIDVWAARMLQRLAGGYRIPSMAETGVSGEMREDATTTLQFGFGQDVFSKAVLDIRADPELSTNDTLAEINDDDLQAVVWFVEKELWTVNNWTNAAGEGGSFELEANLSGPADQAKIKALRKTLDSSKSTAEAKDAARQELAALERTVDRFVGGLSIQMSADTQGVGYVPTDADMARLGNAIRTAIYEGDQTNVVLASKTLSTEGRYGSPERALDLEVVAREGYDANTLWAEMLRQAQAANQDSTFLSRVLREGENYDPLTHRPGVEIYFQEAAAQAQLERVLADLAKQGINYLTVVVDGRRMAGTMAGAMPAAVGVRLQYVPEFDQRYGEEDFTNIDDVAIAAKINAKADELAALAETVMAQVDGVSFAGQFWYETQVAFSAEYQEKIDALTTGVPEGTTGEVGGAQWAGQSVRQGIESADRQSRETASRESGRDLLGGDAVGAGTQGGLDGQFEQAGDRGRGYSSGGLTPLEGAPAIDGATGPDARLVAVAEQYAADNGIDLRRQSEYATVDPERAARIAAAYEAMAHDPQNPAVKEAFQNLITQTVAQYRALEAAGYQFYFFDESNDPYAGNPWNAMRDLRANQRMGVFATEAGFGSGATELNVDDNPLLADTGITWPYGENGEQKRVLANDLFRAVHDAFGHGLEGAGFRAQGEENAWQAHVRLFTGSAIGAITSETRGQNNWLNFGPNAETNQTAKVEDTVFADQKTGLMPEWTWSEGRVADMQEQPLEQGPRGTFSPQQLLVTLNENADLSTFLHESGHFFLEVLADLSSQTDGPQQIKDDMAATLKWFGVPDLATWNSYTLDQKRPYHEKWAESFEQYLFEGKAPSEELQPLFRRFRSWMVNVYKSLTEFMRARDLKMNDEVRQVFGRLLATDEQIAQAEEANGMLPDFEATNEAIEQLQARSLRDLKWTVNARGRALKALQKEAANLRKAVEAEVRAEVQQQPVYRAMAWLKKGEMVDPDTGDTIKAEKGFRLNTTNLAEMYPDSMLSRPDLAGLKGMTSKEGMHPDMVADMFGYPSGDALVRSILGAEPIGSVIEGMTDQRMLENYGELATPEALADAANDAVHNEARARSLATELKSQAEMLNPRQDTGRTASNGRAITVNAITAAARQFALNLAARRRIKDLRNAAWQHRSAEARAGKAWQAATAKGDTQAAVQAKRDQVLNNQTVKALQDAQVEAKKILEFFKRVTKGNDEKVVERGRDPDVVNAMRAILGAYDVAPRLEKSALAYMETVSRNDPSMYAALKPSVDTAMLNAKPLGEMTMEELRGLNDELRAMWSLAKSSRQMEVDGNLLDIEDAADMLMNRMTDIGIPDVIPGEQGAITDKEEGRIKLKFAKALLSRVEQWAERIDGAFGGPFLRLVFQPVKDAADRYRTAKTDYRKKFTTLLEQVAPSLPPGAIDAPELGYTFGNARDSGTAELLHAILHTGNDSNKRKLLLGRGWAVENADGTLDTGRWDQFTERLIAEGKLRKEHYDFAQGVWDLLEEMKPLAQQTHRKVFGRYFAEVTANELTTPFGIYRGGYVPAQTDSRLVKDAKLRELAEGENESMAYAFPSAPSGFTKARVEYNQPLLLDLRALAQHMDKVLLFSHMQGAVTDVRRLLTNKRVSYALDRIDPSAYEGMLIPWLNRSAKQIVETPVAGDRKLSRFLSMSRSRAGMALMFANLSNTVQQITGFSTAAVKVKPGLLLKATADFTASPKAFKENVANSSAYMRDRMLNEVSAMNDAVEQILIDPTPLERGQAWTQRHAYFLQSAVDNTMSPIVWTGAYNQALEEGQSDKDAVRFADGVVRQTQGSTLPEDVSRFETGPAYARLFTQFVGYFNMMANTNATAVKQIADEVGLKKGAGKLLYVALAGMLVPIWVAEAIAQAFRGGPDDADDDGWLDDWLKAVFLMGTLRGLVAQVPIVGQATQLVVNRFNDNPADDKFSLSPAVSLIESAASSPASVYKAIVEDGNAQKAVRDTAAAATLVTGLPVYAAVRPIGYAAGLAQGKIDPTGPIDLARGLVTGTASAESKQ